MPEVIIKYEDPETLKVLEALAGPLGFEIVHLDIKKAEPQKVIDAIPDSADK